MNSDKPKLLIITDFFYPHWTGISKSIVNLTKSINTLYEISVLTVKHQKDLPEEEFLFNSKVIRADYLFKISRSFYSLKIIFKAFLEIPKNEIVLINSPSANILFFSILTKIFRKKLLIFHQGDLILPQNSRHNKLIELVFDIFTRTSMSLCDKVSTYTEDYALHSRVLRPFMKKFSPCIWPVHISENAVEENNPINIKMKKLKEDKKILFGFGGRFVEEKGFDILLKAIPGILEKIPEALFVFAGETKINYENFYENNLNGIKNNNKSIIFLGNLGEQDLFYFYKNLDLFIVPSRSDCFNLMQAEAMLYGCPTITSNIPGARWLVRKTGYGNLFESENWDNLAKVTVLSYQNIDKLVKNYQKVLEILDYQKNVDQTISFIGK